MCVFFVGSTNYQFFFHFISSKKHNDDNPDFVLTRENNTRLHVHTHTHQSYRYFRFGYSSYFFFWPKNNDFCLCVHVPIAFILQTKYKRLVSIFNHHFKYMKQNRKKVIKFSSSTSKKNDNFTTINGLMIKYQSVVVVVVVVVVVKKISVSKQTNNINVNK